MKQTMNMEHKKYTKNAHRIQQQLLNLSNLPKGLSTQIIDKQEQLSIIIRISLSMIEEISDGRVKHLQFLIYVQKEKYPYSPPIISFLTNFSYPRLDDSRNLLEQIIGKDSWWPITTIKQIVQKIPDFAKKLVTEVQQNPGTFQKPSINRIGNYNFGLNESMREQFFQDNAKALLFYPGKYWKSDGYFIGSYTQALIGLGMTNILIFQRDSKDIKRIKLFKVIYRESIQKVTRKVVKKQVEVCFTLEKPNKKIFIKFQLQKIQGGEDTTQRISNLDNMLRCNQFECLIRKIKSQKYKENHQDIKTVYMKVTQLLSQQIELLSNFDQEHLQTKYKCELKELYIKQDTVNSFYQLNPTSINNFT